MSTQQNTTIKDIVKETGYSYGTVSNILNRKENYSSKAESKILKVAAYLNYKPNKAARDLRTNQNGLVKKSDIILYVSHMPYEFPDEFQARRSMLIYWYAEKQNKYPINYRYKEDKNFNFPPILSGHIEGVILGTPHEKVIQCIPNNIPFMLLDVPFSSLNKDAVVVNIDSEYGFMTLFSYLKENGVKSIGTMRSKVNSLDREHVFYRNIIHAAEAFDIKIEAECDIVIEGLNADNHEEKMLKLADKLMEPIKSKKIDAIVCPTMAYSESLYRILSDRGCSIPEDISITGFEIEKETPQYGVTSIVYDWDKMIETSVQVLKSLIDREALPCRQFLVSPKFYQGSTVKVKE